LTRDFQLPSPINHTLVVVGGDTMSDYDNAWRRAFIVLQNRIRPNGRGAIVLAGPRPGTPDALASKAARELDMIHVKLAHDGKVVATTPMRTELGQPDPRSDRTIGKWAGSDACDEVMMDQLARQAYVAAMSNWKVHVVIFHGWKGEYRGELLSERMKHLGLRTDGLDFAINGAFLER
jgi:hypothetical protein